MGELDQGLGALFIGLVVCTLLHGVTLSQAWHFFSGQGQQFKDPLSMKLLVAVVVALDFVHQLCTTHWLYTFLITDFGKTELLAKLPTSYMGMAVPTGIVTLLVQGFYLYRIWKLASKNWHIPAFILLCACAQEGTQLYSMTVIAANRDATQFTATLANIVIAVNAMGAGIDILIAAAMVFLLGRRHARIVRTNRMLRQIAIYSVTTGALTSICALMVLVTAVALPETQYVLLFYLILTRMYSNSLLATLNVRASIRAAGSSGGAVIDSSGMGHPQYPTHPVTSTPRDAYRLEDLKRTPEELSETHLESIAIKVDRRTEVGNF